MTKITITRNAIAHKSKYAMEKFKSTVASSSALLPVERRPAGFLRSQVNPTQQRFEVYIIELGRIARDLC